ncbi:MAG: YebC/PmpR family DNA-binding transcriptional regulator [Acetilactobacillus jinshanensis]
MSGHSKWHNIQGRKGAQDKKRGKIFQKLSRNLYQAAKSGDPDPDNNPDLRLEISKAHDQNMPKRNIKRAIDKATGAGGLHFEQITYEGYGPGGTALMILVLTDNKNRTAAAIRSAFKHHGGSLGTSGSVSYLFDRKGLIIIKRDGLDASEDTVLMDALDAGADDMKTYKDRFVITTAPNALAKARAALRKKYDLDTAEVKMVPKTVTTVPADKVDSYKGLLDELNSNDDVQDIYEAAKLPDNVK